MLLARIAAATPQAMAGMTFVISQLLDKCLLTLLLRNHKRVYVSAVLVTLVTQLLYLKIKIKFITTS